MKRILLPVLLIGALQAPIAGAEIVLYDPDAEPGATQSLRDQGFIASSNNIGDPSGFYSAGDGVTYFDCADEDAHAAGFATHGLITGDPLHPAVADLDLNTEHGFTVHFSFALDFEAHDAAPDLNGDGKLDSAGFSFTVLGNSLRGIAVNFWPDTVWAYEDDAASEDDLFVQAEASPHIAAPMQRYSIDVLGDAYRLRRGDRTLLHGPLRDYSNYPGIVVSIFTLNPFDKPNMIYLGDASDTARSFARIADISVEPELDPANLPFRLTAKHIRGPKSERLRLEWTSLPDHRYRIEQSADLLDWQAVEEHVATRFLSSVETDFDKDDDAPKHYYRVRWLGANGP